MLKDIKFKGKDPENEIYGMEKITMRIRNQVHIFKGALCNIFTGCKQIKNRVLDARNSSLQELT